ncbi:carcinoembryonic antigen-related cell adhesion molecule 6-like isoform X3 [Chiloscyllium plagiosum]|uniref:carcinoembryonic antigen-related cell adhesion molecule 6-like isoform X3 n=1 Tax=Chiloscyllium plagiosum TaxID=36176 RepID=UPI001CB7C96E|nr:carcinoembryonic antigen-related cell adhesion molecule 6-like isoform X3 [Chiloscyllium plagiosum]
MVVVAGDSVLFPTPENGRPNSQTAWIFVTRNHMEIIRYEATHITISKPAPTYEKRILYYSDMRTFVLTQVREDDSGIYEYIDLSTKTRIFTVHLHVYDQLGKPQISSNSTLENSIVALTCSVSTAIQSVTWLISGFAAQNNRYTLINNSRTLVIKNAQKSDSGTYTCFVRNPFSEASASYELTIEFLGTWDSDGDFTFAVLGNICPCPTACPDSCSENSLSTWHNHYYCLWDSLCVSINTGDWLCFSEVSLSYTPCNLTQSTLTLVEDAN